VIPYISRLVRKNFHWLVWAD